MAFLVLHAHFLLGEAQERLAVGLQRAIGEVGEGACDLAGCRLERRVSFGLDGFLVLDRVLEARDLVFEPGLPPRAISQASRAPTISPASSAGAPYSSRYSLIVIVRTSVAQINRFAHDLGKFCRIAGDDIRAPVQRIVIRRDVAVGDRYGRHSRVLAGGDVSLRIADVDRRRGHQARDIAGMQQRCRIGFALRQRVATDNAGDPAASDSASSSGSVR